MSKKLCFFTAILILFTGCMSPPDKEDKSKVQIDDQDESTDETTATKPHPADCLVDPTCTRILVAAHRGDHLQLPENSLAALRSAAEVGADFVEVDVRDTSDGFLVLMHDSDVDRTTDGSGKVDQFTLAGIQELTLIGGEADDPDTGKVPLFSDALALARELGIMLYVDQKTDRRDLVLEAIEAGEYYREALVRDDAVNLAPMFEQDNSLLVMPPVDSPEFLDAVVDLLPTLYIVEIALPGPDAQLCAAAHSYGLKTQQDVMAVGDLPGYLGDYSGWWSFIDAGVSLLQTNYPALLAEAAGRYNDNGIFPNKDREN